MNKKKLFNIILFCGIFLWMIPSAIFHQVDKRIVLFYFGFHIVISLLYAIQFLKVLGNKRNLKYEWLLMYLSVIGSILAHMATYIALLISGQESNIKIIYLVLILRAIVVIYFFVYLYSCYEEADLDKDIKNKLEIEKKLNYDKETNKEKIKGSNKWIYKILLKDFRANIKNYTVFIISAVLTVTYVYGFLGNLFIIHSIEQTSIAYIGEGITFVVLNALLVITIVTILIQFFALKNYIQNRMYDLKTLMLLGMKKKDLYKSMLFLLGISLLISYIIGAILGNGMIFIFRKIYSIYLQTTSIPQANIVLVTGISFVLCVIVLGFIMAIVQEFAIESSVMNVSDSDMEEKMIKPNKIIFILPIFLIILMIFYSNPHWAESKYIFYPWIIIFAIFTYYVFGYVFRIIKSKNKYSIKNILTFNLIFYKSKSYMKNSLLLYTLLLVMFSTYIFQISALFPLETKELYPYDYVCLGYEKDKNEFENIEKQFDVESGIYPVVRITVPGGEDGGYGNYFKILPIGHHLGISESTYKKLSGKNIDLKDKEIYILYQEDKSNKAHPLDFYVKRSKPLIRIGQAQVYNPGNRLSFFTSDYDLVGEKREIVLGRLSSAMYENIVVFSDEYFESQHKETDGIRWLTTINSDMKNNKNLENYLDIYEEAHKEEESFDSHVNSVYRAGTLNKDFQGEKIFKLIINISIIVTFAIASIIIVFVHTFGNISYYKNRYEILSYLGEKKKNSNDIIKKEVMLFAMLPYLLALLTSLVFIGMTVSMRGFNYFEIITSGKIYTSTMLAFLLIYVASTFVISNFLIKDIGGK